MSRLIIAGLISYLIGSIPTSYIIAKLLRGIDIRDYGSGNIGATNLIRVVGKTPGIIALLLDVFKGVLPLVLLAQIFYRPQMAISKPLFSVVLGLCVVFGHIWTIFLRFKGGKGVATTIGVFIGLMPLVTTLALVIWLIVVLLTKYVSLGSLVMAVSLPLLMIIFSQPTEYILFSVILCIFICYKHKDNIKRLIEGREFKIGERAGKKSEK